MPAPLKTHTECHALRAIIRQVNPRDPMPLFANPRQFALRAEEVALAIRAAGFPLVAVDVEQARDIARCHLLDQGIPDPLGILPLDEDDAQAERDCTVPRATPRH